MVRIEAAAPAHARRRRGRAVRYSSRTRTRRSCAARRVLGSSTRSIPDRACVRIAALRCSKAWAFPAAVLGAFIDMMFGGGGGPVVVIYLHARGMAGSSSARLSRPCGWWR